MISVDAEPGCNAFWKQSFTSFLRSFTENKKIALKIYYLYSECCSLKPLTTVTFLLSPASV